MLAKVAVYEVLTHRKQRCTMSYRRTQPHDVASAYPYSCSPGAGCVEYRASSGLWYRPAEYRQIELSSGYHRPSQAYISDEPLLPSYNPAGPRVAVTVKPAAESRGAKYHQQQYGTARDVVPNFFTDRNVNYLKAKIDAALYGVKGPGVKADVSLRTIQSAMSTVYSNEFARIEEMNDRVIHHVVSTLRDEVEMENWGNSLDPWVQQMTGEHGMVAHPKVKINHRHRTVRTAMLY